MFIAFFGGGCVKKNCADEPCGVGYECVSGECTLLDKSDSGRKTDFNALVFAREIEGTEITSFSISPNPNKGIFTILITAHSFGRAEIKITDATGKVILTLNPTLRNGKNVIPVFMPNDYQAGVYLCRLTANEKTLTTKIICS